MNLTTNGFLDEFKLAQANLQANLASGVAARANSFAYFGPGTGTSPLPIYLANFNGRPQSQSGDASLYTGANWTNTARLAELAQRNPNPGGAANTLFTTAAFRTSLAAAGYPRNFFVLNPDVGSAVGDGPTGIPPSTIRCRSTCVVPSRAGSQSTPTTRSPSATARRSTRSEQARATLVLSTARRAARAQDDRDLRAAVRPRQAIRRRTRPPGSTPRSAAGR